MEGKLAKLIEVAERRKPPVFHSNRGLAPCG